jgi:hypothetical protein
VTSAVKDPRNLVLAVMMFLDGFRPDGAGIR